MSRNRTSFFLDKDGRTRIPVTEAVTLAECKQALSDKVIYPYEGFAPQISMSTGTVADAIEYLAPLRRKEGFVVCGLNFAHGQTPGGQYSQGGDDFESDLCRRVPKLWRALKNAQAEGLYPFGPCTQARGDSKSSAPADSKSPAHADLADPAGGAGFSQQSTPKSASSGSGSPKVSIREVGQPSSGFATVLYTPGIAVEIAGADGVHVPNASLILRRKGVQDGYGIVSESGGAIHASIVSAAAPNLTDSKATKDTADKQIVLDTITSIFIAPLVKDCRHTTLILGPWACHDDTGHNPKWVANEFARAVKDDHPEFPGVCLGDLWHEIHFAMGQPDGGDCSDLYSIFREALSKKVGAVNHLTLS